MERELQDQRQKLAHLEEDLTRRNSTIRLLEQEKRVSE